MHLKQYIGPSDYKTASGDPISYSMIVYGCLNPFLAISKFFDSYRALASPGKLEENLKSGIFGNFGKLPKTPIFGFSSNFPGLARA